MLPTTTNQELELFKRVIEESPNGILITDATKPDNPTIYVNKGFELLTGYSTEEILGRNCRFLQGDDRQQPELNRLKQAIEEEIPVCVVLRNYRKDGTLFYNELHVSPVHNNEGLVINYIGIQYDVTSRVMAEEATRQREQELQLLLENSPDVISRVNREKRYLYVNAALEEATGGIVSAATLIGKTDREVKRPESMIEPWYKQLDEVFESGQKKVFEFSFTQPDGEIRHFQSLLIPELSPKIDAEAGEISSVVTVTRDTTVYKRALEERRQVEKQLREQQEEMNFALQTARMGIWSYDYVSRELKGTTYLEKMHGLEPGSFSGRVEDYLKLIHPDDRKVVLQKIKATFESGQEFQTEFRFVLPDGMVRWAESKGRIISNIPDQATRIVGIVNDITARKLAEEQVLRSELRFRSLIENSTDIIELIRADRQVVYRSPSFARITGYSPHELDTTESFTLIHPDDLQRVQTYFEAVKEGYPRPEKIEFRFQFKDRSWHSVEVTAQNMLAEDGVEAIVINGRDITEQLQAHSQLQQREEQLRQAQKMEAVGQLAGGIAHDFNNLLTAIMGYTEMALTGLDPAQTLHGDLKEIERAVERAASLTRQLLAFSRRQVMQPVKLNLNETLQEISKLLRRLIGENIELKVAPFSRNACIKADPGQLEQVILNLAVNARDAMPAGGTLALETSNVILDEAYVRRNPEVKAGRYVLLTIRDSGCGMDEKVLSHIFEPFFTTKEVGKGTGLGLSTVYGIIKQSEGHIEVESRPGEGSSFKIYLPEVEVREDLSRAKASPSQNLPHGSETVLLVEDEEGVRKLLTKVLQRYGYKTLVASNGSEALLKCEQTRPKVDLLITDMVMPQMSGPELAQHMAALYPDLKILFMSGYTEQEVFRQVRLDEKRGFVQKPFTTEEVVRKIRSILDQR
ncbi:MAG TPA: PAS domain S-box protein [Chloroflexia bacterium]|nr:PAS domain S-box protein [Chloroflexia bacterium]